MYEDEILEEELDQEDMEYWTRVDQEWQEYKDEQAIKGEPLRG